MFAKTIIDSDAFLDMPLSAQALYFHLSMRADDDGFINNPKKIRRSIGASEDDLRLLMLKNFIIPFESGVVVIKHWKIHNYIRNDRYKETVCTEEKALLTEKDNKAYTIKNDGMSDGMSDGMPLGMSDGIPSVNQMDTQVRLGKDSIGKDSINNTIVPYSTPKTPQKPKIEFDFFKDTYNRCCPNLIAIRTISEKRKTAIRKFLKEFSEEQFEEVCIDANKSQFLTGNNDKNWKADFDFIIKPDKATSILEGKYKINSYKDKYESKHPEWGFEFENE